MKYDIWLESFTPPFSSAFLPLFTRRPVVGLAHMLTAQDMQRKYLLPFGLIENFALRHYRYIIATSRTFAKKIKTISPATSVTHIPNGLSFEFPAKGNHLKKDGISFVGRIEVNQKGLDLLLSAFGKISDRIPGKLRIAGTGEVTQVNKLKNLIRKSGLEDRVVMVGRLDGKAKTRFFCESSVMVIPSRFETFSLSALEAVAARVPLVCFDIEGLRWLPRQVGIKIPPYDTDRFARAMLKLATGSVREKQYTRTRSKLLAEHNWNASAQAYRKLLSQVLSAPTT